MSKFVHFSNMAELDEKTDSERLEILGELPVEVMVFQPLLVKEISIATCVVETAFPLHLDSFNNLHLTRRTVDRA